MTHSGSSWRSVGRPVISVWVAVLGPPYGSYFQTRLHLTRPRLLGGGARPPPSSHLQGEGLRKGPWTCPPSHQTPLEPWATAKLPSGASVFLQELGGERRPQQGCPAERPGSLTGKHHQLFCEVSGWESRLQRPQPPGSARSPLLPGLRRRPCLRSQVLVPALLCVGFVGKGHPAGCGEAAEVTATLKLMEKNE